MQKKNMGPCGLVPSRRGDPQSFATSLERSPPEISWQDRVTTNRVSKLSKSHTYLNISESHTVYTYQFQGKMAEDHGVIGIDGIGCKHNQQSTASKILSMPVT